MTDRLFNRETVGRLIHDALKSTRQTAMDGISAQRAMFMLDPANANDSGIRFDVLAQQVSNKLHLLELELVDAMLPYFEQQAQAAIAAVVEKAAQTRVKEGRDD